MTKKVSPPQSYVLGLDVFLRTTSNMAVERRGERELDKTRLRRGSG
jgi:hypothetical protein